MNNSSVKSRITSVYKWIELIVSILTLLVSMIALLVNTTGFQNGFRSKTEITTLSTDNEELNNEHQKQESKELVKPVKNTSFRKKEKSIFSLNIINSDRIDIGIMIIDEKEKRPNSEVTSILKELITAHDSRKIYTNVFTNEAIAKGYFDELYSSNLILLDQLNANKKFDYLILGKHSVLQDKTPDNLYVSKNFLTLKIINLKSPDLNFEPPTFKGKSTDGNRSKAMELAQTNMIEDLNQKKLNYDF